MNLNLEEGKRNGACFYGLYSPICEIPETSTILNVGRFISDIHPINHRGKCFIVMSPDENKISMVSFDLREPYEEDSNEVILETQ